MRYIIGILAVVLIGFQPMQGQVTEISFVPTLTDCAGNPAPCDATMICFALELESPDINDVLSSYTLILQGSCSIGNILSNTSCVMNDASQAPSPCFPLPPSNTPGIIFQSNGNAGNFAITPNTPVRIHTLCVELAGGENTVDLSGVNLTVDYINTSGELNPVIVGQTSFNVPNECDLLPVELESFTAKKKGDNQSLLEWVTATEMNTSFFEVQRSSNGFDFETLDVVKAAGNSYSPIQYRYVDRNPKAGQNQYRLRIVDNDGYFEYSGIRTLEFLAGNSRFSVFPNPATDFVQIQPIEVTDQEYEVQVFNHQGSLLYNAPFAESRSIDFRSFARGAYVIQIVDESGRLVTSEKIVKVK